VVAARHIDNEALGRASALFSGAFFLNYVTGLGLPIAITRWASGEGPHDNSLFAWSAVLTIGSSIAGSVVFLAVAPDRIVAPIGGSGVVGLGTMGAVVAALSLSVLVDARLVALRRWQTVFWRTTAIAVVRLAAVAVVPNSDDGRWTFLVGAGAYGLTGVVLVPGLLRLGGRWARLWPLQPGARGVLGYAAANFLSQLAVQAPLFATPVVVSMIVPTDENGPFYLAWGVAAVVLVGVQLIAQTQLAEGARGGDRSRQAATSLVLGLSFTGAATIASVIGAGGIAALFGAGYDDVARHVPLLVPGCVAWVFAMVNLTLARLRASAWATLVVAVPHTVCVLAGVLIGAATGGALGASTGWLVGNVASLVVSVPPLVKLWRGRRSGVVAAHLPLAGFE
jgi:O-antigen/teichoic acid export membrane protein